MMMLVNGDYVPQENHLRSGRLCVAAGERGFRAGH